MSYVFISYASADRDLVLPLVASLRQAGINCWLDEHDIAGGANWGGSIAGAIEGCAALVLMSSQASLTSRNVRQEIALAWQYDKPAIPLRLDPTPVPNDIAYWLATAQWINVLDDPIAEWLPKVSGAVARIAPQQAVAAATESEQSTVRLSMLTSLPSPPSSFIGRERDVAEVAALLHTERVVTLTGPGGTGKTRLAIAVGRRLAREYRDGIVFVDLAPLHDPALVLPTVAASFGVQDIGARTILDALIDALHDRRVLMIVDNVEQVIDAAADLGRLVARCPALTLLATSREPLRISGETEHPIAPLPLPDTTRDLDRERLRVNPAVALFVQRARAVRADFDLTVDNAQTVVAICSRLDGLPLAVELAAARIRSLPVAQLLERLEQPLRFLTGGARDMPARQQTIRGTIQWSHDLLSPDEQRLFRRLAVFALGWTLETAEAVVDVDGDLVIDVQDGLISLAEKSLIVQEQQDDALRYRFLVPIREFAAEQLSQHAEALTVRRRHAEAMRDLVRRDFSFPRELHSRWLRVVRDEYVDIRSAMMWAIDNDDSRLGIDMVGPLGWFWVIRGDLSEGRGWIHAFLDRYTARDALRARAHASLAILAWERDDVETADQAAEDALAIARELKDSVLIAEATIVHACVMTTGSNWNDDEVQAALATALALAEAHDFAGIMTTILLAWADHDTRAGHYDHVEALGHRLYAIGDSDRESQGHAAAFWCFARVASLRGDNDTAARHCREALLANQGYFQGSLVWTLELLGTVMLRGGRSEIGVRLMAVTSRERRLKGLVPMPWWQAHLADADEARTVLDPAVFDEAWRVGSALSLEEGIALALEATDG